MGVSQSHKSIALAILWNYKHTFSICIINQKEIARSFFCEHSEEMYCYVFLLVISSRSHS